MPWFEEAATHGKDASAVEAARGRAGMPPMNLARARVPPLLELGSTKRRKRPRWLHDSACPKERRHSCSRPVPFGAGRNASTPARFRSVYRDAKNRSHFARARLAASGSASSQPKRRRGGCTPRRIAPLTRITFSNSRVLWRNPPSIPRTIFQVPTSPFNPNS